MVSHKSRFKASHALISLSGLCLIIVSLIKNPSPIYGSLLIMGLIVFQSVVHHINEIKRKTILRVIYFLLIVSFMQFFNATGEILIKLPPFYITVEQLDATMGFFLKILLVFLIILFYLEEILFSFLFSIKGLKGSNSVIRSIEIFLEEILMGVVLLPEVFSVSIDKKNEQLGSKSQGYFSRMKSFFTAFPQILSSLYYEINQMVKLHLNRTDNDRIQLSGQMLIEMLCLTGILLII